jgi:molybdopterin/thiamine biosynthesis adenylyltransferase
MEINHVNRAVIAIAEKHNIAIDDALKEMNNKSIWLVADETIINSYSKQLSFITTLNIAHRIFLNGVYCVLPSQVSNLLKFKVATLNDLVVQFSGICSEDESLFEDIKILFGKECYDSQCIEIIACGWRGGVNFFGNERIFFSGDNSLALGPILASSIATYYAFCKIYKLRETIDVNVGISLWNLNAGSNWYHDEFDGPINLNMPRTIWDLGLGHLGQAYIWTLASFKIENSSKIQFLLQDSDVVDVENLGSQVLCQAKDIDKYKTRPCLQFIEEMGFDARIIEKRFELTDDEQDWMSNYPLLLNGVDNVKTRKSISNKFIKLYLDGATNGSSELFDSFTMNNVYSRNKTLDEIWTDVAAENYILHRNLYDRYEKAEKCGSLSNIGISTPFVGLFSSTIIVSELLRSLNQGEKYSIISLQMRDLYGIEAVKDGFYNKELFRYALSSGQASPVS